MLCQRTYSKSKQKKKKKKKGLNVEHRKSTTQMKKLLKETRLLPLPPPSTWWTQVWLSLWLPQNTTQSLNYKSQPYTDYLNTSAPFEWHVPGTLIQPQPTTESIP